MTDLTEQWKKGELPEGYYYVKDGENMIAEYLDGYFYNNGNPMTSFSGGVDKVLAPVPPYEVYKDLIDGRKLLREYIKDTTNENAQLKELLKECKPYIALYTESNKHIGFTPEIANLLQRIKEALK